MAQLGDVRVEESLKVKIGEAKNLPPASSSGHGPKTCCAIKIDSEEIFRTPTVDKSLDPFFNAEFQGDIPKKFRYLSFYLYDVGNKNKVLGKVCLKKEELYKYHQKEHWFPLTYQDGGAEVQGKVQLEVRMEEYLPASTDSLTSLQRIAVRVLECSDLTVINGACNPYATVTLVSGKGKSKETHRTSVRKKTICPQYDETFLFSCDKVHSQEKSLYRLDDFSLGEISVSLFHDDSKVSREVLGNKFKGSFLGEVKIPLKDINFVKPHRAWYCLQAKESTKTTPLHLGSIRLCINYSAAYVFPSKYYDGLRDLILMSPEKKPISSSAAFLLGEIVENRQNAAQPLVKLFLHHGKLVGFIHALADWEIANTKDPNTLFRGNSLLTKTVDELMKYLGLPYLHDTIKTVIDKICTENKPCEIDPNRLKEGEDLCLRLANLHSYVQELLQAILDSSLVCPPVMRDVFAKLKAQATINYPGHPSVKYHAVTSFVFLRFFTAAILGPKLFDLVSDFTDLSVQRNLTLISKAISGLVSLVTSQGTTISVKEEYMVPLFDLFRDDSTQNNIKIFLEIISSSSSHLPKSIEAPIILKEGYMIKRAQGRKKFGRKNFKKRFFVLTNQSLSYSTCKGGKVLFEMFITDILAVEKVQEESFKMKYMFQIVQTERTLYIQANNCVEEKEWLDTLTKICKSNRNRRTFYHPAAFIHMVSNSHWLCCKSKDQNYVGCTPVTGGLPLTDIQADIDSDREVEKIHSLFLEKMDKLEMIQGLVTFDDVTEEEALGGATDACGMQAVYAGDIQENKNQASGLNIEDPPSCFATIAEIQRCIITLEQEHIQYMRSVQRHTVIGSIDTPIGDESGADLVRNMNRSSERLSRHGSRSSNASNLSRRSGRGCRSRGGSFRERERSRSGTENSGGGVVKKSVSGDVATSGQNNSLGGDLNFKQMVKKAASYDAFSMDRRSSHGAMDALDPMALGVGDCGSGSSLLVTSAQNLDYGGHRDSPVSGEFIHVTNSCGTLPSECVRRRSVDTNSSEFLLSSDGLDLSSDAGPFSVGDSKRESLATDLASGASLMSSNNDTDSNIIFSFNGPPVLTVVRVNDGDSHLNGRGGEEGHQSLSGDHQEWNESSANNSGSADYLTNGRRHAFDDETTDKSFDEPLLPKNLEECMEYTNNDSPPRNRSDISSSGVLETSLDEQSGMIASSQSAGAYHCDNSEGGIEVPIITSCTNVCTAIDRNDGFSPGADVVMFGGAEASVVDSDGRVQRGEEDKEGEEEEEAMLATSQSSRIGNGGNLISCKDDSHIHQTCLHTISTSDSPSFSSPLSSCVNGLKSHSAQQQQQRRSSDLTAKSSFEEEHAGDVCPEAVSMAYQCCSDDRLDSRLTCRSIAGTHIGLNSSLLDRSKMREEEEDMVGVSSDGLDPGLDIVSGGRVGIPASSDVCGRLEEPEVCSLVDVEIML